MPYIQAKIALSLTKEEENNLQKEMTNIVSETMGKPKAYIMTNIECNQKIWMADEKLENGAYISISYLGNTSKQVCNTITQKICDSLSEKYHINCTYITFQPIDIWGYNGKMF